MKIALTVNGRSVHVDVTPRTNLADFLREHMLLTGTHVGCEHGICGACTVEVDGEIARSCITYAVSCDGAHVRTIEGFDDDALMARLRQAFTEAHALQCGYCTPGMLVAARDLVRRKTGLSRAEIRTEMSGNLCRCTGYMGIVTAIERVMADRSASEALPGARPVGSWLGPAPGPQAAPVPAGAVGDRVAAPVDAPSSFRRAAALPARRPVAVTVGAVEEHGGTVRLAQYFVLEHPRERVWALMSDPQAVARCMPGASLDGPPVDGKVNGRIAVRLGPVAATFTGEATVTQFPSEYRQVVEGQGGDRKSGSRVTGSIEYRLAAVPGVGGMEATRVDVVIGYGLTGLLGQLGRSALARDLARHMGEAFAQNVDAHLAGASTPLPDRGELGAFELAFRVFTARIRSFFRRLLGQ
jgi:carbon-monoxide dehydrogenase small subunit